MTAPVPSAEADVRFPSLAALRVAHAELLKRQREISAAGELQAAVLAFLRRGQATGALLDEEDDRWEAQSILDYWVTFLFRADRTVVDGTLDELDPELAPELDDAACPYVGLDAFRESRFNVFFGRQRLVQSMLDRLAAERFLAAVGSSGSGKSSVMLGGVLASLKGGAVAGSASWLYLPTLVPGSEPLVNLARALSPAGTDSAEVASRVVRLRENPGSVVELVAAQGTAGQPAVLVVDQLEELFTLCDEEPVRQAFADALSALVEASGVRHTLLVTLRSDYESRVARLGRFQELFENAEVRVTPLSAAELREAIVRPAELAGLKFEDGVVDALLRDILGEPAGLPLLQFTLLKLWESRERNRVTWQAYRRLGGGRLALARTADELYASLIPEEQVTARRLLLRMVRPSEGLEVMSSRVRRADLYRGGEDPGRVDRVLDKLIGARLLRLTHGETPGTPADDQVEVAHEALVRNWPKLVDWLEEERAEIAMRRRLESLVDEWLRLEKRGGLLDEAQLQEAERWLGSASASLLGYHPELPALVQASRAAIEDGKRREEEVRKRELEQAQQLAEAERRRAEDKTWSTRLFRTLAAISTALLLLSIWSTYRAKQALTQAQEALADAREQKAKADTERRRAEEALLQYDQIREQVVETRSQNLRLGVPERSSIRVLVPPHQWEHRRFRPLQPGASLGSLGGTYGSLCCVVQDRDGQRYLLTLPFVLDEPLGATIVQPAGGTEEDRVGVLERTGKDRFKSGALVKLDAGVGADFEIPTLGTIRGVARTVAPGDTVRLVGSASGIVEGMVIQANDREVVTSILPSAGDAGGPVLSADGELIGLLYGSDKLRSFVVRIEPVLGELGVELVKE